VPLVQGRARVSAIEGRDLCRSFGATSALRGATVSVAAREMAAEPKVLFADEPTGYLAGTPAGPSATPVPS
jgi:hypothetical protein